jgi:four helix bundle protein
MRDYRKLEVWRRAHQATLVVYRLTAGFPDDERFGLVSQMRRAAASIPMNIAEGSGRSSAADYARFLISSSGSLNEIEYQLTLGRDLGYMERSEADDLAAEFGQIRAMLTTLADRVSAG